jgi:4-azaleucine resistance transporter AzlC
MESATPQLLPPPRPEFLRARRPVVQPERRQTLPEPAPRAELPRLEVHGVSTQFGLASGITCAIPIVLGYFPVAFALGILAAQFKFPFFAIALMSLIVFAGSSQFAALSLLTAAAPAWSVVLTVFVVNFRHFLMSLAIAPQLKSWSLKKRILFAAQMTDETFALHMNQFATKDPGEAHIFAINMLAHSAWFLGTVSGYWVSWLLPDTRALGFDIAMPCMFIALIVLQARNRLLILSGVSAALFSLAFKLAGLSHAAVLAGAIIGATIGAGVERWKTST